MRGRVRGLGEEKTKLAHPRKTTRSTYWKSGTLMNHTSCTSALVSCSDVRFRGYDTAVVSGYTDAIVARGRTWNLRDTVVHETRWE